MNKTSKRVMFIRAGRLFVRVNKRVLKPRACLTSRMDGPMRIILATLNIEGENVRIIFFLATISNIIS